MTATLWTIGHSTHSWETFAALLQGAGIATLVDVRRFAASRRHPQFGGDAMAEALPAAGIAYVAMPDLGGRRPPSPHSRNTAWRNAGFRGYADWMAGPAYGRARERLGVLAAAAPTAIMCAEALWWQCHRGLVSDDFKASGWEVLHIESGGRTSAHPYTGAARIVDGRLDYSLPADAQADLFSTPGS